MNKSEYTILFAPGSHCYTDNLAKYCPNVIVKKNGEDIRIINTRCDPILPFDNHECVKFAEIISNDDLGPITGAIGRVYCGVKNYFTSTNANGIVHFVDTRKFNLGQDADLQQIHTSYLNIINRDKDAKIICFGVSRGACAMINYLALYKPANVKGAILEGASSCMEDIVENSFGLGYMMNLVKYYALMYITSYKSTGPKAVELVVKLPRDIPILMVTSQNDWVVPYQCSVKMYEETIAAGYTNIELVVLEKPGHNDYSSNNDTDTKVYMDKLDKFFSLIYNMGSM